MIIDSIEGPDLMTTTKIAKLVRESGVLESSYPTGCRLEVSFPGITSSLSQPFQYRKHVGKNLKLVIESELDSKDITGKLLSASDEAVQLELPNGQRKSIEYILIQKAVVELTFDKMEGTF